MKYIKYIITILVIAVAGGVFYNKVYIPKSTYKTITPQKGDLKIEVFGIGNIDAKTIYKIDSEVSGRIKQINTDLNRFVKKGELVATIDDSEIKVKIEEANLSLKKANLNLSLLVKSKQSLIAKKEFLEATYKRDKKLLQQGFIPKATFDKSKSEYLDIIAQINSFNEKINLAKQDIKIAQKNIKSLQIILDKYKIFSPVDGYIITKNISLNQNITPNGLLFEVVNPKDVWAKVYIDEKISGKVKIGKKAKIKLYSNNKTYKGRVVRIMPKVDLVTNEKEVNIAFNKLPTPFYIGAQVDAKILVKTYKDIYKIPLNVVSFYNKKQGIWVKQNNKAHFIPIKMKIKNDKFVKIDNINLEIIVPNPKKKPLSEGSKVL